MTRTLRVAWWAALWLATPAWADEAAQAQAERQLLARQRAAVAAEFAAGEQACRLRFAVTACVDELHERQRTALTAIRKRELALDDAQRRRDAEARGDRREQKQADLAGRAAHAHPGASASADSASGALAQPPPHKEANPDGGDERRRARAAQEAAAAASRAAAHERRASDAAAHRERIETRNAERAAHGRAASPLPDAASATPR